ncbi:MAG: hypothetical protein RJB66_1173 [Pseudomonadota bacterium]|jgi:glucosylceramidase
MNTPISLFSCVTLLFCFLFFSPLEASAKSKTLVRAWMSTLDGKKKMTSVKDDIKTLDNCSAKNSETTEVVIDDSVTYQAITGFGAALTESSAYLLKKVNKAVRKKIIALTYGQKGDGRFNMVRIPIGATDFAMSNYSCADEIPDSGIPTSKKLFNFEKCMGTILPVLKEIKAANPDLLIVASPWSPPAWMKSSKSLFGGKLLPDFYQEYAEYLSLFLEKMAQENVPVDYLTVINEPLFTSDSSTNYPWTQMEASEQARFISDYLAPHLKNKNQFDKVMILSYDHNWDNLNFPTEVLKNPRSAPFVAGTAFHCYKGHFSAAEKMKAIFPDKEIHLTECSSGNWSPKFDGSFEWALKNLLFGQVAAGAQSLIYWNLVLDAENGPQNGGCKDCRGILNLNKELDEFKRSPEFYLLHQASSVIYPNSLRIKSTAEKIEHHLAFKNPDLSLSWIGMNTQDKEIKVLLKSKQGCLSTKMKPKSVLSINWP